MNIEELVSYGFPENLVGLLKKRGITQLNPVQEKALKTSFLENNANLVIASPTGSGKTLIAELAALRAISQGKRVLYTCPLRALASEHRDTFNSYRSLGIKVALSIGDYDSADPWLTKYDWIITTNEKADSLMRHRSKIIPEIGLLVVDEVHLLDSDRGPTLETVITRFRQLFPDIQVIALSATIPNAKELADWLDAELIESNWRPTKLVKGVYHEGMLETTDGTIEIETMKTPVYDLCRSALEKGGEALVFVNTRRSAEAEAERLKPLTEKYADTKKLALLAEKVLNVLESPTKQCRKLADCVRHGVAFHHAGLVQAQRKLIETAFRKEQIRVIAATPTLAAGVNTPADVVVIRDAARYTVHGLVGIPVREYYQMAGRAGRPNYGKDGLAILVAKNESQKEEYMAHYIYGKPEQVRSQFGIESVMRAQLLASIALHFTPTLEKLAEFLMHTYYAFTFGVVDSLNNQATRILRELKDMGFIVVEDELQATRLGMRVAELYIDPLSAYKIIDGLGREKGELGWLYDITNTEELKPYLRVKRGEEADIWVSAHAREGELGVDTVNIGYSEYDFLEKYKTTLLLWDWINEKSEEKVLEDYGIAPGILRARLSNAEWIAYAGSELCKVIGADGSEFRKMQKRIKYGVKKELLPLVELRGIGRVRARKLHRASLRRIRDLEKAPLSDLTHILGPKVASSVKKQLGQD
ncbi:MAG: DEAD/DEAH box helicase [Candidatus Diapherotrites archaeon]|nr:DEAD/DEAH box helicase [Candidatus Diapherotrites archaeon]